MNEIADLDPFGKIRPAMRYLGIDIPYDPTITIYKNDPLVSSAPFWIESNISADEGWMPIPFFTVPSANLSLSQLARGIVGSGITGKGVNDNHSLHQKQVRSSLRFMALFGQFESNLVMQEICNIVNHSLDFNHLRTEVNELQNLVIDSWPYTGLYGAPLKRARDLHVFCYVATVSSLLAIMEFNDTESFGHDDSLLAAYMKSDYGRVNDIIVESYEETLWTSGQEKIERQEYVQFSQVGLEDYFWRSIYDAGLEPDKDLPLANEEYSKI